MLRTNAQNKSNVPYLQGSNSNSDQLPTYSNHSSSYKSSSKSHYHHHHSSSSSFIKYIKSNQITKYIIKKYKSNPFQLQLILFLITSICLIIYLFNTNLTLLLFKFKLNNSLVSSGWIGLSSIYIRKSPLIFIHSSQSVTIVWETNKLKTSSGHQSRLQYWTQSQPTLKQIIEPDRNQPNGKDNQKRWVHSTLLDNLIPGESYTYQIILSNPTTTTTTTKNQYQLPKQNIKKVYSTHQFNWLGIDSPDLTQLHHLSSTSPKSVNPTNVLHIAIVGDNQFGLRTFKQIIKRLINIKSYLPHFKSAFGPRQIIHHFYKNPIKPDLLFHLGDAVQDSHNLIQWQTDFWDPFTHQNPMASELPILYTRGNHDFDPSSSNIYSGGLPLIQIGELNRSQTSTLSPTSPLEIPGIAEADQNYTTIKIHKPHPHSRATYHAYSPHPRVRVLVCDSNLEPTREAYPGSKLSEVDEHERWLLWEMARPEWKEASIRIILVHVPPFVEYWDPTMWLGGHENLWGQYVRTRFAPHFHALSTLTRRYDIPPASMVISGHSHAYSRGLLSNFVADSYFDVAGSSYISRDVIRAAKAEHSKHVDPSSPQLDNGVVYVISGGAGGTLDKKKAEHWGFYEKSIPKHHFGYMMIDMSNTLLSIEEWGEDWQDSRDKRIEYKKSHIRTYKLVGSQLVCNGTNESWESGHYSAIDRLVFTNLGMDGKLLDRFVIEANSCR